MEAPIPLPDAVAANIRAEMAWQQKSIAELAAAIGLDRQATKRRYDGRKPFSLVEIDKVAAWLGVSRPTLIAGTRTGQAVAS